MKDKHMIDFIGDVHGHAEKLIALLTKLDYSADNGSYCHPEARKVIFVGDYIDRGPKIQETLEIVRGMVENGNAIALLGNHEHNAICFHYQKRDGGHLREHLIKNILQHYETLRQFQNHQHEYEGYIDWFKTLPLFHETQDFRVVHACWDNDQITYLRSVLQNDRLDGSTIHQSAEKNTRLYNAIEETLKGKEIEMPDGVSFTDKDGHIRKEIRIKWWKDPMSSTWKDLSIVPLDNLPNVRVVKSQIKNEGYYQDSKPVFFGHYWLNGKPMIYTDNICCLDFSVAKNGYLVAYRFDGESKLDKSKLVYV